VFGTGFIIHKNYKCLITDFHSESERPCSLRVKGKFVNITIICINAPTEEKGEERKDAFYDNLERLYLKAPKHNVKIVMGGFNVRVDKEYGYAPNVRKYSLHK
jgi:exonuclease III